MDLQNLILVSLQKTQMTKYLVRMLEKQAMLKNLRVKEPLK